MSDQPTITHPVAARRLARGWSQLDLARQCGVSRSSISAIESARLSPSVDAALALAQALETSVEDLFGATARRSDAAAPAWAWAPEAGPVRYWSAEVGGRRLLYPAEALSPSPQVHDGVWQTGTEVESAATPAERTLVMACCDPAAGLLAAEYARVSGFRLLVFSRGGEAALNLLARGLVHIAGLHRSTREQPDLNTVTVRAGLGPGYRLVRGARWEAGLVLPADERPRAVATVLRQRRRWALREPGSAARELLESLTGRRRLPGRVVEGHAAVARAVRAGWADAGIGIRLVATETGTSFIPLRTELLDLCMPESLTRDPRGKALLRVLASRSHRRLVGELPGYDARDVGEVTHS
jgi:molybdate-binding protein/transcriptional regulator with XRE-family HTH domain